MYNEALFTPKHATLETVRTSIPTRAHFPPRFKMADLLTILGFWVTRWYPFARWYVGGKWWGDCFKCRMLLHAQKFNSHSRLFWANSLKIFTRRIQASFPHDERNLRTSFAINNANRTNTDDKFVWRPVIAPQKQILAFLWRIAYQEPARAVADHFDLTPSSVDMGFPQSRAGNCFPLWAIHQITNCWVMASK